MKVTEWTSREKSRSYRGFLEEWWVVPEWSSQSLRISKTSLMVILHTYHLLEFSWQPMRSCHDYPDENEFQMNRQSRSRLNKEYSTWELGPFPSTLHTAFGREERSITLPPKGRVPEPVSPSLMLKSLTLQWVKQVQDLQKGSEDQGDIQQVL